jgi:uncharacterized repeat protein (TIGR04138 family)
MKQNFQEIVSAICEKDSRYQPEAYAFLIEALDVTLKTLFKENPERAKHLCGKELMEGIRQHALAEFGPMTYMVFSEWGLHSTEDFGEIVFHLVEAGRLGKTETDSKQDFKNLFTFEEAFLKPFEPTPVRATTKRKTTGRPSDDCPF